MYFIPPWKALDLRLVWHTLNMYIFIQLYPVSILLQYHFSTVSTMSTRVTRRVSLIEQKLLTLQIHMMSLPVFVESVLLNLWFFFVVFCGPTTVCLFVLLAIVLSVLLSYGFWSSEWHFQTLHDGLSTSINSTLKGHKMKLLLISTHFALW